MLLMCCCGCVVVAGFTGLPYVLLPVSSARSVDVELLQQATGYSLLQSSAWQTLDMKRCLINEDFDEDEWEVGLRLVMRRLLPVRPPVTSSQSACYCDAVAIDDVMMMLCCVLYCRSASYTEGSVPQCAAAPTLATTPFTESVYR